MCLVRHFEFEVAKAYENGLIPGHIYLSVGQESPSATISTLNEGYSVFAQHRCHSVYLSHGGRIELLIDELLGFDTGCCQGKGGSPCVQDLNIPMYGHHGLIGENIPLATGYALATGKPTVVYFGDAAAEEDYALTSFGFAATHELPILFVCEDNDLAILTHVDVRRKWHVYDVTRAMGLDTADIEDDPKVILDTVGEQIKHLPAFVNIRTCRHLWHTGYGTDGPPQADRLEEMRHSIDNAAEIEKEMQIYVEELWKERLQRQ